MVMLGTGIHSCREGENGFGNSKHWTVARNLSRSLSLELIYTAGGPDPSLSVNAVFIASFPM